MANTSVKLEMPAWPGNNGQHKDKDLAKDQDEDQDETPMSLTQWLWKRAQEKLLHTLPVFSSVDINDLKARGLAPGLAAFHLALYVAVALYLVVSGTAKQLATKYLSLTAPDASTATCSKISCHKSATIVLSSIGSGVSTINLNGLVNMPITTGTFNLSSFINQL